ncbi:protein kinase [Intrasporangium sp. DVR]|uniref:serine/threonine-protein kinase n=1 Tax=Intrasporangium sp. DVR TaxID=3127867 RepID=UPI00313A6809
MSQRDVIIAGRYRLIERIGVGGMGSVWQARDERLQRTVAAKLLHLPPGATDAEAETAKNRAMREARITAKLHHPHAVPVFDVVEHEGQPCLIMQYLPSRTLQEVLAEGGALAPDEVALIGAEVGGALAAAHAAGIVHRDVKPANILITEDGSAKITDFGISRALGDATLTAAGMVTGTPAYLAPEVARGEESSPASDVFSLGATLYAAVEGAPPFGLDDNPMALLHRVASEQVSAPASAGALTPLLLGMLAARSEDRPSMAEVVESLQRLDLKAGAVAEPTVPEPTVAEPTVPEPTVPEPTVPEPTVPEPTVALPAAAAATQALPPALPPRPSEGHRTAGPPPLQRRSRRGVAVAVAVLALALVAFLAVQALLGGEGQTPAAAPPETSAAAGSSPSSRATSRPTKTTPSEPTTSSSSASPTAGTTTTATEPAPRSAQLTKAVRDYYALLPDDTDEGYQLLTERYRSTTAGSQDTYEAFWDDIRKVSVRNLSASPPGAVEATLTYTFDAGRVVEERTAYGLVEDDGVLKIDSSTVLSSRNL